MELLTVFSLCQSVLTAREYAEREQAYLSARSMADATGKPLLNIGCPSSRLLAYPCGDVCLDIDPQRLATCHGTPRLANVTSIPYADGTFGAALCLHVLEHLPTVADAERAFAELQRVAGAVYVCSPSRFSLQAWLHPDHSLWVDHQSDGSLRFEQRYRGAANGETLYPLLATCWRTGDALLRSLATGRPAEEFLPGQQP